MASEDSDQAVPGLLAIHRLGNLRDVRQTRMGSMDAGVDHSYAAHELLEITLLR